jgi:hypothetical protein
MPTQTEMLVDAFASCRDARCPGYEQQPVQGRRVHTSFSYVDNGGDWPGEERSVDHIFFVDGEEPPCPFCGKPMFISEQERPEYVAISGQDPMRIYDLDQTGRVRDLQVAGLQQQAEVSEMRREMAELRAELASRPRGPGRPRKVENDDE